MFALASGAKIAATVPGLVGQAGQRHPRLVLVVGDARDELPFHVELLDLVVGDDERSGLVLERREDLQRHVVAHGKADRAGLQDLGPDRRQLEHLLIGDGAELSRARDDARVGGEHALDVGVDVAAVRLDRDGERDGRRVGAAAAERREVAFGSDALETRDDRNAALREHVLRGCRPRYGRSSAELCPEARIGSCQPM